MTHFCVCSFVWLCAHRGLGYTDVLTFCSRLAVKGVGVRGETKPLALVGEPALIRRWKRAEMSWVSGLYFFLVNGKFQA